jgi:hypothetical protein
VTSNAIGRKPRREASARSPGVECLGGDGQRARETAGLVRSIDTIVSEPHPKLKAYLLAPTLPRPNYVDDPRALFPCRRTFTPWTFLAIGLVAISTTLATCALWAANDPFVGDWKLDPSRSKLTDVMKVEKPSPPVSQTFRSDLRRPYDTARSSSVPAHRVAAINMAWVRAS